MLAVGVLAGLTGAALVVGAAALSGTLSPQRLGERAPTTTAVTTIAVTMPTAASVAADAVHFIARVEVGNRTGSALILHSNGVLVTSSALVAGAKRVSVVMPGGERLEATVAGTDPMTGLAALQVDKSDLTPAELATGQAIPGEQAVLVGAADGEGRPMVSVGAVSRLGQKAMARGDLLHDLIETDRPVAADADGGALVTIKGKVAGICLHTDDQPDAGAGYATPIRLAGIVVDDLIRFGEVHWPWLGLNGGDLPVAEATALKIQGGAVVSTVMKGSPAETAGVRRGDIVVGVGGVRMTSMGDVGSALRRHRPGDAIPVDIRRNGAAIRLMVTLGRQAS
jgi:putative serine protease PepD